MRQGHVQFLKATKMIPKIPLSEIRKTLRAADEAMFRGDLKDLEDQLSKMKAVFAEMRTVAKTRLKAHGPQKKERQALTQAPASHSKRRAASEPVVATPGPVLVMPKPVLVATQPATDGLDAS
jgi:hypothetical protein